MRRQPPARLANSMGGGHPLHRFDPFLLRLSSALPGGREEKIARLARGEQRLEERKIFPLTRIPARHAARQPLRPRGAKQLPVYLRRPGAGIRERSEIIPRRLRQQSESRAILAPACRSQLIHCPQAGRGISSHRHRLHIVGMPQRLDL